MPEILYEVNWLRDENDKPYNTVTPITVFRRGILPNCSAESIIAVDSEGYTFNGSPADFYETEAEAWDSLEEELVEQIQHLDERILETERERAALAEVLAGINQRREQP